MDSKIHNVFCLLGSWSKQLPHCVPMSPVSTREPKEETIKCGKNEVECDDQCVPLSKFCDEFKNCSDGKDEEPCNPEKRPSGQQKCVLPPYPEHGRYRINNLPFAAPGQVYDSAYLNVTCHPGYSVDRDTSEVFCFQGFWSETMPKCIRFCKLPKHPSVKYICQLTGSNRFSGSAECGELVPAGTRVWPECEAPNYYYQGVLNTMRCIDGVWDYIAICKPECGLVSNTGTQLITSGIFLAKFGEMPWHVAIYRTTSTPYMQICSGTLVSSTAVISAAHCFWNDMFRALMPTGNYAVGLGKIYRQWDEPRDFYAQKSHIKKIKVPARYNGIKQNLQEDIAILLLANTIQFQSNVRPVCLDFDETFNRIQLQPGNLGKIATWSISSENGAQSPTLKVIQMQYIDIAQCLEDSPSSFQEYISSDKICAGNLNGEAFCKGNSGGGLVFPSNDQTRERFYLRGIASSALLSENQCNVNSYITFTQIIKHQYFIQENINIP